MAPSKAAAGAKRPAKKKAAKKAAAKKGPGRPEYVPRQKDRERVEILMGGGMGVEETAAAMDLSEKTFRKHFAVEIKVSRAKKRAEMIDALFRSGMGGNVSAQKAYLQFNILADVDEKVQGAGSDESASKTPKAAKVYEGKKEIAQREAMSVGGPGTEWGDDLNPTAAPPSVKH